MRKTAAIVGLSLALGVAGTALAAGGAEGLIMKADNDLTNTASLQRGARNYVNYCMGCHSLQYVRYNRMAADLGLTEDQVTENLMFAGEKLFEPMTIAMPVDDARRWFGAAPPDLTLTARSRGTDWLYTYLKSFYVDGGHALGSNNLLLKGASMPHVLWELQGLQRAVFEEEIGADGKPHEVFKRFEELTPGSLSADEYSAFVRDLVNFLDYASEPVQIERRNLGIKVLAFLLVFGLLAYALKKEYWKDVR